MQRQWDEIDERAYMEAQALAKATADRLRRPASRPRMEELMPGLERLERRAAILCGDVEFFAEAARTHQTTIRKWQTVTPMGTSR